MASHANSRTYVSEIEFVPVGCWPPPPPIETGTTSKERDPVPPITAGRTSGESPPRATMTVEEAGAYLGIGRSAAYAAARSGSIPVIRVGRRMLVPRAALERMLAEPSSGIGPKGRKG
jgi:excisionase family DNA binding protein